MNPRTVPTTHLPLLQLLLSCSVWLGPTVLLLTPLTSSAQTPAPPTGGYPSASRLQEVYARGQDAGYGSFKAESNFGQGPAPGTMDYQLESALRSQGPDLSPLEREVFTDGFRKGADKADRGMTTIDPPKINVQGSDTSSTTTITGKTPTAEPGTLQLTDKDGNSYFVDVDANGNYKRTVPQADFQPVKATLWTKNGKLVRAVKADGTWTVVSSARGTAPTQGAMSPGGDDAAQQVAYLDECKKYGMIGSLDQDSFPAFTRSTPWLRPVRLLRPWRARADRSADPPLRLVSDPLPSDAIRAAQELGITHADQEYEKSELEKIPEGSRTQAQTNRLNNLNKMIQEYKDGQTAIRKAAESNNFVDVRPADIAKQAAEARRLQRQAQQMRTSGMGPQAESLEKAAQTLYGGSLPPLHAGTAGGATGTSGRVEGQAVDPTSKPLGWIMATGVMIFPREHPDSLKDQKLDQQLREAPADGCTPFDTTDGEGKFNLRLEYRFGDKLQLDHHYRPTAPTDTDTKKSQPEPTKPKTPAGPSSTQGAFYRTGVGAPENCAYAYTDTFTPQMGLTYSKKPWTLDVGKVMLNTELGYNFQITKGTEVNALQEAQNAGAIASTDVTLDFHQTDGIGGIGHLQTGWQSAQAFQEKIPNTVLRMEEETCTKTAPAPSWNQAHWPAGPTTSLPVFHVQVSD